MRLLGPPEVEFRAAEESVHGVDRPCPGDACVAVGVAGICQGVGSRAGPRHHRACMKSE